MLKFFINGLFIFFLQFFFLHSSFAHIFPTQHCGNESEPECGLFSLYWWHSGSGGCDRGLTADNGICVNRTRHLEEVREFKKSWKYWALKYQRYLANDVPINLNVHLSTHNSTANLADTPRYLPVPHFLLNQWYSLSDLMDLGVRVLDIDIHMIRGYARTCHGNEEYPVRYLDGSTYALGCLPTERFYFDVLKEIRNWINNPENAQEVLILFSEDYAEPAHGGNDEDVNSPLEQYLGELIFTPEMLKDHTTPWGNESRWPTPRELIKLGKRIIYFDRNTHGGRWLHQASPYGSDLSYDTSIDVRQARGMNCSQIEYRTTYPWLNLSDPYRKMRFIFSHEDRVWGRTDMQMTLEDSKTITQCNISPTLDQVSVGDERLKALIWSWAPDHFEEFRKCTYLQREDEHWHSQSCEERKRGVCRLPNHNLAITQKPIYENEFKNECQHEYPGSLPSAPRLPYEQLTLIHLMKLENIDEVRLNLQENSPIFGSQ